MCLSYRLGRVGADVPNLGGAILRMFSKRFFGAVFRGKPETYLWKLQLMGLRNLNVAILQLGDAGDVEEKACVMMMLLVIE